MSEVSKFMSSGVIQPKTGGGGVPAGRYQATWEGLEFLPALPVDEMTGKSKRQFECLRFNWKITEGEHKDKIVSRETTTNTTSLKGKYLQTVGMLIGRSPEQGFNLNECVGKTYTVMVGNKLNNQGMPTNWLEVVQCL